MMMHSPGTESNAYRLSIGWRGLGPVGSLLMQVGTTLTTPDKEESRRDGAILLKCASPSGSKAALSEPYVI